MSNKFGIIADDLTGANDSGVQLAKKDLTATVVLDFTKQSVKSNPDVLIVDTDSRAKTEKEAFEAASQAASLLFEKGYHHIYKKVDSTLRGNIATELAAIEKVYQPDIVVIAPAFPKMKRTTLLGNHYVNGELITETEFGRDPKTPVKISFLPDLFKEHAGKDVALLELSLLRGPKKLVVDFIDSVLENGQSWIVCDGETEADLQVIAEVFSSLGKKIVWTGSGGLVEYLPDSLGLTSQGNGSEKEMTINKTLVISGSLSQVTKKQLTEIRNMDSSYFVEINPVQLVNNTIDTDKIMNEVEANVDKRHLVVYVDSSEQNRVTAKEAGEAIGLSGNQVGEAIARGLGEITNTLVEKFADWNGLILTGGDIAKAVCLELGIYEMELHSEVEPGLPFGQLLGEKRQYWAVTKAGGFGNEQSLVNALKYMTRKVECYESN